MLYYIMKYLILLLMLPLAAVELSDLNADKHSVRKKAIESLVIEYTSNTVSTEDRNTFLLDLVAEYHKATDIEYRLNIKQVIYEIFIITRRSQAEETVDGLEEEGTYYYSDESRDKDIWRLIQSQFEMYSKEHKLNDTINPWEKDADGQTD